MPRKSARQAQLETENAQLRAQLAQQSEIVAPLIREIDKPKKSGFVTVACKIPQGLRLQLQHQMESPVPTGRGAGPDDYVMMKRWVFGGPAYNVFGPSMPVGAPPEGYALPDKLEGGYALTVGRIPADFWETWIEQNRLAPYVLNKMIFAYDEASTVAAAREHKTLRSGLEPISFDVDEKGRSKDPRVPRSTSSAVARVGLTNSPAEVN